MSLGKKVESLGERVASGETAVKFLCNDVKNLEKAFRKSDFNPLWLRIMIVVNGGIFAWLSTLTWILINKF